MNQIQTNDFLIQIREINFDFINQILRKCSQTFNMKLGFLRHKLKFRKSKTNISSRTLLQSSRQIMKYVPSALVGQLSKSQGSTTAARNRFGSYFRNRTMPVNPSTALQSTQRAILSAASFGWRALTDAQRDGWAALGLQMTRTDSLGQTYSLTGLQAYSSVYRNVTTYGGTPPSDAPALSPPTNLTSITITATAA